ncbi:BRO-N domain-containing protein [Desulfobacter postgatei]|uniref:BRO-N domain-containing protein n=1 Tax=Desulfobacter postgatei TaxID=2293 RepID=UPI000232C08A|nr:Bro-N domain-containing protein [Desulfobacter postgatei]
MSKKEAIQVFEDRKVRTLWDDDTEEWYFSIVDVVAVLTDSVNPTAYWRKLKERLKKEGNQTVTDCHGFKMQAADGKMRKTDCADTEQLFRLIQSTVCVKQVVAFFSNEVPSSTAQFSHGLRRAIGGPFSAMRELCYTVPYSNGYAACLSAVFSAFCCLNFFKVTVVPGSQFLVLPDHLSGCFDLAF